MSGDSGIGDPYWYEWSVGLTYVLEMLDPGSNIVSVTLQQKGEKGLDDVVLRFANGDARFIQVKHTRSEDTLTFGDFVAVGEKGEPALLHSMAAAWLAEVGRATGACEAWLVSNRAAGQRHARAKSGGGINRPPLAGFLQLLKEELAKAGDIGDICLPAEWQEAWFREWLPQLKPLDSDELKLKFLHHLRIVTSAVGLEQLGEQLVSKIRALFSVDVDAATRLRSLLDGALRIWATSLRGRAQAITREAAYEKLCLADDSQVGEHALAPPAPFFGTRLPVAEQIASLLVARASPVVFLVGEPGSGKTALISHLANRRSPVIDARFHAYRPITPENPLLPPDAGRTTTARALWSDLLLQLRALARGRLAAIQVPVHAGSLTVEALRQHVLRIADGLGQQEGRPFVIAVDGVDHAARAGVSPETFLSSLVGPGQVPANVVFLIGGQPPDSYPNYPLWLRSPTRGVQRFDLPRLTLGDTLALVRARSPTTHSPPELENVARDVWQHCQGHTLSTVFAVEEALLHKNDLAQLGRHLANRQIASGVESYYAAIWFAATRTLLPETGLRLAACLCLAPVRATAETVRATLEPANSEIPEGTDWSDFLRRLRPLVVEDPDGFRVFHNDVRVFLHRLLCGDTELLRDAASRMADSFLHGADALARHVAAQTLFAVAGRYSDQAALFTPAYVLEGHAIGRTLDELTEQGLAAAEALAALAPDWDLAHLVATGLRTLEQLRSSLHSRTHERKRRATVWPVATKAAERRVPPKKDWSEDVLLAALDDIAELHALGEGARAVAAFGRWFEGLSPMELALSSSDRALDDNAYATRERLRYLLNKFGEVCAATEVLPPWSEGEGAEDLEANFSSGLLEGLSSCARNRDFMVALRRVRNFFFKDIYRLLTQLVKQESWLRCMALLRAQGRRDSDPWPYRIQGAALAAVFGDDDLRSEWVSPLLSDRPATLRGAIIHTEGFGQEWDQLTVMAWTAFLFGFEEPTRNASLVREEMEAVYRTTKRDDRKDLGVWQILRAAALLGSFARSTKDGRAKAVHVGPESIRQTVSLLMTAIHDHPHEIPFEFPTVAAALVKGFSVCAKRDPAVFQAIREVMVCQLSTGQGLGVFLEDSWRTLLSAGDRESLLAFADKCVGPQGWAWEEASGRYELISSYAQLLEEAGELARVAAIRERLPWMDIGYGSDKEYVLRQSYEWFEALAKIAPNAWRDEGMRILGISRAVSRAGDNRFSSNIEVEVLAGACMAGPASLAGLTSPDQGVFRAHDPSVIAGWLKMVKRCSLDRRDLLVFWAFCSGQLCWQADGDRRKLVEARESLMAAGERLGGPDLAEAMARAAPAEFACERDKDDSRELERHDYASLEARPVEDAMRQMCDEADWRGMATILERIKSQHPAGSSKAVDMAWAALRARPEHIWWYDGATQAFEEVFALLNPTQRWEGVKKAVSAGEPGSSAYRTNTLAENLDDLCRLTAVAEGGDALQRGLLRLLDMHELWLSGCGKLPGLKCARPRDVEVAPTWTSWFIEALFRSLSFDEQSYVQAALRGLERLLTIAPSYYKHVVELLRTSDLVVRRRFLLMAEALAGRQEAEDFRAWLAVEARSPHLDQGLAAWSALRTGCRLLGRSEPSWPEPGASETVVVPVAPPLLVRPSSTRGLATRAGRASTTIFKQLEAACYGDVDDVRAEFAASIRAQSPTPRPEKRRGTHVGDFVADRESDAELERLFLLLGVRERQGRFRGVPTVRLAQALVPFADPFVFLRTPRPCPKDVTWPIDRELDELISKGAHACENVLAPLVDVGLDSSRCVIAAVVRTFSYSWDIRFSLDHVITRGEGFLSDGRPSVLNGRATLCFEEPDMLVANQGAPDQEWLTQTAGGLLPLMDASLDFFPGRVWRERLSWEPDTRDPLCWTRDGDRVTWFERMRGPVRRIYGGDCVYRQPLMARWVCRKEEWQRVLDIMGTPQRRLQHEVGRYRDGD